MQKKNISNIDLNFEPLNIPIVKGRLAFVKLKEDSFPLYVTPKKKGLEIIIREGHPLINQFPYIILNTQFRTRFKSILELTSSRGFTVHATLFNGDLTEEQLFKILISSEKLLPIDLQLYVTMVLYEKSIDEMLYKNITDLVKAFFGTKTNPFIPNVVPAIYTEVRSKANLEELASFLLSEVKDNEGIYLLHKYGYYKQGKASVKNTDAVVLYPTEDIYGIVTKLKNSAKFLPGETLEMTDSMIIKFGETELIYDLSDTSLAFRGMLHNLQDQIIGSNVLCELLFLPNKDELKIKSLKRFVLNE